MRERFRGDPNSPLERRWSAHAGVPLRAWYTHRIVESVPFRQRWVRWVPEGAPKGSAFVSARGRIRIRKNVPVYLPTYLSTYTRPCRRRLFEELQLLSVCIFHNSLVGILRREDPSRQRETTRLCFSSLFLSHLEGPPLREI